MRTGRVSVFIIFMLNGVIAGCWGPRVPAIADQVGASPGELGVALFGAPVGLVMAASFAGRMCARFGARVVVLAAALVAAGALPVLALVRSPLQLGLVLIVVGAAFGVFDVSINVAAVTVVRRVERPVMPVFHAGFSFGGLAGALAAALAANHGLDLLPYFVIILVVSLAVTAGVIGFVPREEATAQAHDGRRARRDRFDSSLLRRPLLWLLGTTLFCAAIAEGSNYDWAALFGVRERGMSEAGGALLGAVFCAAMGIVRLFGERIQRRFGAVRTLVVGALHAGVGLLLAAIVPSVWVAYAGYVLAGGGVAMAFPVVLDLAGAVGRRSDGTGGEREVGFVTTIAYSGFLIGPPMFGAIAELTSLSFGMGFAGVVALLMAPAALASAAAYRREEQTGHEMKAAA